MRGCRIERRQYEGPEVRAGVVGGDPKREGEQVGREVYDPGLRIPTTKRGLLAGMGMTEKQGGSDVRTNSTLASPTAEAGVFTLTGHKWFTSAPM